MGTLKNQTISMHEFESILSNGSELQIDPDQDYIFKWRLDWETHRVIMNVLRAILSDNYSNFVVGDAMIFFDELKHAIPLQDNVAKDIKCSGLAVTALGIVLYEIWSNEELTIDKARLHDFVNGLYTRLIPVEN